MTHRDMLLPSRASQLAPHLRAVLLRNTRAMASAPSTTVGSSTAALGSLENIKFDNSSLRNFFVEHAPASKGRDQRNVPAANFSLVEPDPVENPQLVAAAEEALALLGISPDQVSRPEFAEYFSGNRLLPGTQPAAHCYCGHQFGYFSGQLGDGAAMYLGEVVNSLGERWELQLKGAGMTPYSRAADGRKVLRSSIREFLCSEAMYHLGIPTTRSGSCVTSDTRIVRDPLYDGNIIRERATVISRIAPTFLRFGSFEIFKPTDSVTGRAGPSQGMDADMLPRMLQSTISTYFPALWAAHQGDRLREQHPQGNEEGWHGLYRDWMVEVAVRTASLVAGWQSVGWCHGVLNTDNMSIVGLTIDYGPFGFLDAYNPDHVCNGSDDGSRYTYSAQPAICRWNIEKLGEAVRWAVPERITREALEAFDTEYDRAYMGLMRRKLGLLKVKDNGDLELINSLLQVMADAGSDWTNTWRALSRMPLPTPGPGGDGGVMGTEYKNLLSYLVHQGTHPRVLAALKDTKLPASNLQMLLTLANRDPATLHALGTNAQVIQGEAAKAAAALKLRRTPPEEKEKNDTAGWDRWLHQYSARLGKEVEAGLTDEERREAMNNTNPRYVLRNWMAQSAIAKVEQGDYSEVRGLLDLLRKPFTAEGEEEAYRRALTGEVAQAPAGATNTKTTGEDDYKAGVQACELTRRYDGKPPAWASKLCVTCSS